MKSNTLFIILMVLVIATFAGLKLGINPLFGASFTLLCIGTLYFAYLESVERRDWYWQDYGYARVKVKKRTR